MSLTLLNERTLARPGQRLRLASTLPLTAERARCGLEAASLEQHRDAVRDLWALTRAHLTEPPLTQWPALGTACLAAADLLSLPLEVTRTESTSLLASYRKRTGAPVYALVGGAPPIRVFRAVRRDGDAVPPEQPLMAQCRALLSSLLGRLEEVVWGLEQDVLGRSSMAALVLRELIARWPGASGELEALGITGEFDAQGQALPVSDIPYKVARFFKAFPGGVCFVPASQLADARKGLAGARRSRFTPPTRLQEYRSLTDLLIRLGVTLPHLPATRLFQELRERSRTVLDWRRQPRLAEHMLELSVTDADGQRLQAHDVIAKLQRQARGGTSIVGEAGSGKSMFLRRLHHALLEGAERWSGPSIRVDGRRFKSGALLASLVAQELSVQWSPHDVDACLRSQALAGSIWLLVDGLDEVPETERALLLHEVAEWPGRFVLSARPMRDALPGLLLEMAPLDSSQSRELLKMEGREDLTEGALSAWQAPEPEEAPVEAFLHELCRTPFGVSLVATLVRPERLEGASKQRLLAEALRDMVGRAVAENRLDRDAALVFELRGERLLGAAAWRMLQAARAELGAEDFDSLPVEGVRPVLDVIERSGLVQRAGPGRWAFNHKSFAEHCAARYLLSLLPEEATRAVLERLGSPGVDEVLLHISAELPREALSRLLDGLLTWKHPLSALTLATRVLLEVEPSHLQAAQVLRILEARLRLMTWLPDTALPGGAGREAGTWRALERLATAGLLGGAEARRLFAACHPEVRQRLQQQRGEEDFTWKRGEMTQQLAYRFPLEVPLPILLGFENGPKLLAERRGRGPWAITELLPLLQAPGSRASATVQLAWCLCAPIDAQLRHLELLSLGSSEVVAALLKVVLKHGSEQHKKEALLRAVIPRLGFQYWLESGEYWQEANLAELAALSSEQWLSLWDWAWATGALMRERWEQPELERLYAHYLHDGCGPARWRAVRALGNLVREHQQGPPAADKLPLAELRTLLLHEPLSEVRTEVLELLRNVEVEVPLEQLWSSLVTLMDAERWVAWALATQRGWRPSLEQLVQVLVRHTPKQERREEPWVRTPEPLWKTETEQRGESARHQLCTRVQQLCKQPQDVEFLLQFRKRPEWEESIDKVLGLGLDLPTDVLRTLLREGTRDARVWATERLSSWLYARNKPEQELLAQLVDDTDSEVAKLARESVERHHRQPRSAPRERTAWADENSVGGFDLFQDERERMPDLPPLRVEELPGFTHFEALWGALEQRPLELKGSRDMVSAFTDEAIDWFVELAQQAREENLQVVRPVLDRLTELFRPEFLPTVVDALDHPRLGFLASELLRRHPPGRRLLPAFQRSETAAVRATRIAQGTALAPVALDALLDALAAGGWPKRETRRGLLSPDWTHALHSLGGLEGLVRLLQRQPHESIRTQVFEYIDRNRSELVVRLAEGLREQVAGWARSVAAQEGDAATRASALRLLALLGTPEDASAWAARLEGEALTEPVGMAALELLARLGAPEHVPLLERMLSRPEPSLVIEALRAMGEWAEPERLLQLLQEPPPALGERHDLARPVWSRGNWRIHLASGIVRRGTRPQALKLAMLLKDDSSVWKLARDEGHLPEHALLVLGHVRHDPGDRVMPASVTGTGDEVFSSDVPDEASSVIARLVQRLKKRGEVASALLEGLLQEEDGNVTYFLEQEIRRLGGPGVADVPRLLQHLSEWPDSTVVLSLLARTGAGEPELTDLWERLGVPWWQGV